MQSLLKKNARHTNKVGEHHISKNTHPFAGIAFCGKCGVKMTATPGRLHADGFRGSNYSCPNRRNSGSCDGATVSDTILGEFVVNYILNMVNAKKSFSKINTPADLQRRLLYGSTFSEVDHIDPIGLNEYFKCFSIQIRRFLQNDNQ